MSWRVLHVLDHSWPILDGYGQRSRSIVASQVSIGMCPAVLTSPLHEQDDPSSRETCYEGVRYFRTTDRNGLSGAAIRRQLPLAREMAVVRLLQKRIEVLLQSETFDLVHAHSPALCGLAALRAARSRHLPFVYEVRAFWEDAAVDQNKVEPDSFRYRISRGLETYVLRKADAAVAIAKPLVQDIADRGILRDKIFHVANGVNASRFTPLTRDLALARELGMENVPVLGFLGTLFPWEGISTLIPAVAKLHQTGVAFKMLIVGDGADAQGVRDAIRQAGAADYVHFLGRVPNDRVEQYYSLMDVLVYPRRANRLTELVTPLKPLEAMALGKAVLGSNVGGIRELIDPDVTGLLFEQGNADDFCSQAKRLLLDIELRNKLGACAREAVITKKDWKTLVRRYEEIYSFALESQSRK